MKKPELLAPAGDWASLRAAVESGADAVYLGLKQLTMRANAKNFEISEMKKIAEFCHSKNVRVYVTLNTIVYNSELQKINDILDSIKNAGVDAIIAWDFSVIQKALSKKIEVHLSTQASVSNVESARFFKNLGVSRINLARECSLKDIMEIKKKVPGIEIETFIHGAMCVSVSGRCFISQFLTGKSANRGECIQQCRRTYTVKDNDTGYELVLDRNRVMSPKDLCVLPILDKLVDAGIDAFKIEGRVRPPEYVKVVTSVYRQAMDAIADGRFNSELKEKLMDELKKVYSKQFSTGFYLGAPSNNDWSDIPFSDSPYEKEYAGRIEKYFKKIGVAKVILHKRHLAVGDRIIITGESSGVVEQTVSSIEQKNTNIARAEKGTAIGLKVDGPVHKGDNVFVLEKRRK